MDFDYYYSLYGFQPGNLRAYWDLRDTASGQFNRTSQLTLSDYGDPHSFTILSTVDASTSGHILFSNYQNGSGWTLGINQAQKPYLQVGNAPVYCFPTNLAKKNAIAFSKAGDKFSFGTYDFISKSVDIQDVIIKGNSLSSGNVFLGGNDNYESNYPHDQKLLGEVDIFVYIDKNLYKSDIQRLFNGFRLWNGNPPVTEVTSYLNEFKMSHVKLLRSGFINSGATLNLYNQSLIPAKVNLQANYSPINGRYLTQESETGVYSFYSGVQQLNTVDRRIIDRNVPKNTLVLYDSSEVVDSATLTSTVVGPSVISGNYFKSSSVVNISGYGRAFVGHDYLEISQNHQSAGSPIIPKSNNLNLLFSHL